jgi:hypothetical protein
MGASSTSTSDRNALAASNDGTKSSWIAQSRRRRRRDMRTTIHGPVTDLEETRPADDRGSDPLGVVVQFKVSDSFASICWLLAHFWQCAHSSGRRRSGHQPQRTRANSNCGALECPPQSVYSCRHARATLASAGHGLQGGSVRVTEDRRSQDTRGVSARGLSKVFRLRTVLIVAAAAGEAGSRAVCG